MGEEVVTQAGERLADPRFALRVTGPPDSSELVDRLAQDVVNLEPC